MIQTQLVDYNAEVGFPIFTMNDQYANDIGHKLMMKSDVDLIRQKSFIMNIEGLKQRYRVFDNCCP